jgi:hypothetical protein
MAFDRRIKRKRGGRYELRLSQEERLVLAHVAGQLREAILTGADAPTLRRLTPPAYVDDPEKEAGFQALARDELLESRLAALDELDAALADPVLDADRAGALMRSCNALRLVLGTRLDVHEEVDPDIDEDDPEAPTWALYYFLSSLVGELVDALSGDLPAPTDP